MFIHGAGIRRITSQTIASPPLGFISFSCAAPAASWSPSRNPKYGGGYARTKKRFQPKDFSDGGDLYSYSHGEKDRRVLEWEMLPDADMTTLLAFMAAMKGGRYTFSFTDYDINIYTARILNYEAFEFLNRTLLYWKVMLEIEFA